MTKAPELKACPCGEDHEPFANDGKCEKRWIKDMENACPCCGGSGHKDDVRADLRPVVKPLEWREQDNGSLHADVLGLEYVVGYEDGSYFWNEYQTDTFEEGFAEEDHAKAAAKADCEQRILSRLALAPVTPAQAAEVLLEMDDYMPVAARMAAVKEHTRREGKVRPVTVVEGWRAALRAIAEGERGNLMSDVTATDMEGETVRAGDRVAFSYGIPPVRVEGVLFERDGVLIMPTPEHTPKEGTLAEITKHTGGFWKVGISQDEYAIAKAKGEA